MCILEDEEGKEGRAEGGRKEGEREKREERDTFEAVCCGKLELE